MPWHRFLKEGRRHRKRGEGANSHFPEVLCLNFYHTNATLNNCHLTQLSRTSFFCFLFYTHFPEVSVSFSCFIFMTPMPLEEDNAFLDLMAKFLFLFSSAACLLCRQLIAQVDGCPFLACTSFSCSFSCWPRLIVFLAGCTGGLYLFAAVCLLAFAAASHMLAVFFFLLLPAPHRWIVLSAASCCCLVPFLHLYVFSAYSTIAQVDCYFGFSSFCQLIFGVSASHITQVDCVFSPCFCHNMLFLHLFFAWLLFSWSPMWVIFFLACSCSAPRGSFLFLTWFSF